MDHKKRGINFAMHSEFFYHSKNCRHSGNLNFAMHRNFHYHSENLAIAKFSLGLRNFGDPKSTKFVSYFLSTTVVKLLQYRGLGSNTGMGSHLTNDLYHDSKW